jgi:glycosyltransferase involved in cell wall biosynthesis
MCAAGAVPADQRPLSIAYLTYRGKPHVGGQGIYTRHLTKALVDLGHTVEVFSGQPYPVVDARVALHELPSLDLWNDHFPGRLPAYWELRSKGDVIETLSHLRGTFGEPLAFSQRAYAALSPRRREFDLVHDNQCLGYGILALERIIPTIVTLHHPITRDRALEKAHAPTRAKRRQVGRWYGFVRMQGRVAKRMPRIVVVSENSINDIHADMGVPREHMRLVPVGVDPTLFRPLPTTARRPGRLITTASADVAIKGLAVLLEAMAKLRTERDIRLTIIGTPRAGANAELIDTLGLRPYIEFVGGVPDARIVELYAESELAVVPSLYEGFSLPAIEAMATGTCLVATDGGALPEVTGTDGDTVLQARAGDVDSLAAAICRGLDDAALRARVGDAGRRRVIHQWTWRHCAAQTVEQYHEVLSMPANQRKAAANGRH